MSFRLQEAIMRKSGNVNKDISTENLLVNINEYLRQKSFEYPIEKNYPLIFVLGMHRSGTTLMTQVLRYHFGFSVINNIVARFWDNPLVGAVLYKSLNFEERETNGLESFYGKTKNVDEPHEFSYFWQKHFLMEDPSNYNAELQRPNIDWLALHKELQMVANVFQAPLIVKGFDIVFHMEQFIKSIPNAFYIFVERDKFDTAVSIYNGRLAYYGDESCWLGSYPVNYEELKSLPAKQQILGQINSFNEAFKSGLSICDERLQFKIKYSELATEPKRILGELGKKLQAQFPEHCFQLHDVAPNINLSTYKGSPLYDEFASL